MVALALGDAEHAITYKAKLPWNTGELAVVTFCDASFAGESGHKPQRGRFDYLTSAKPPQTKTLSIMTCIFSYSSSTMQRVCRATLQCEAYSLQHAAEHSDRIRAAVLEVQGKLPMSPHWEEVARRSMFHLQFTDCRSLSDHLTASVPRQCDDKRLSIEMAGLRQSLWEDDTPTHVAICRTVTS